MSKELTLAILRNTSFLEDLYGRLIKAEELGDIEYSTILKIGVSLLRTSCSNLKQLGYRIILMYGVRTGDYYPLYDTSINLGYFPVIDLLKNLGHIEIKSDSFLSEFQDSFMEIFRLENYTASFEQLALKNDFSPDSSSQAVIAPTSYGKSELIEEAGSLVGNVCVLVPTKALLAQTKKRLIKKKSTSSKVLITHPDMELPEDKSNILAILTQERLLRILQQHRDLSFSSVFVDEAHNLLEDSDRSRLLATSLISLKRRDSNIKTIYLTPFIKDINSLQIKGEEYYTKELKIAEKIKSEQLYVYDFTLDSELLYYEQYFNEFVTLKGETFSTYTDLIKSKSGKKNIVYQNKPINAQAFAIELASSLDKVNNKNLMECIESLKELTHSKYDLLFCLERGVIYHHGSMPDNIKLFVEYLYSSFSDIKYIVTTSTLLEGVNIPAEKLFVLDNRKGRRALTSSQFKNLIGRVCRFSEVFNPEVGGPKYLMPEIYIMKTHYCRKDANIFNFIRNCMKVDKKNDDKLENILLEGTKENDEYFEKRKEFGDFINNVEPGVIAEHDASAPQTSFGKDCFENNIFEVDIIQFENKCSEIITRYQNSGLKLSDPNEIMEAIYTIFFNHIRTDDDDRYLTLKQLQKLGTRNFYGMLLGWRINNTKMFQMIGAFLGYWEEIVATEEEPWVFVGKWGEEAREGFLPRWINLNKKNKDQLINLAIVRIKDEQDFVDNSLMKFIEVLYSQDILDEGVYKKIKYGTTDQLKIDLSKGGISLGLASLVTEKYSELIVADPSTKQRYFKEEILSRMESDKVNKILSYEASFHVK